MDPEQVHKLAWEGLVPAHLSTDGPFADLTQEQLELVVWVFNFIDSLPPHGKDREEFYQEIGQTIPQLKEAGIDINELMAKRKIIQTSIVEELNGQRVRIPGYFLPLEMSDFKVTEFLLVPYIGACIHVPPPPPNQIVHVRTPQEKGYSSKSIYEPVWVTGVIIAKSMVKYLYLSDGSAGVNIGYTMQAKQIEPYKD